MSSLSSPKLITVFGATGNQGGSVVQSLLKNKSGAFKVRGITRNPDSDASKALAAAGVEMVKADGFNQAEMVAAFRGSWGAFVNTNSDDPALMVPGGPTELDLGRKIVDAAAEAGVEHFVYSGMASATEITKGAIPDPAFDEKHAVGEYAGTKTFKTVVLVSPGWFLENNLVEQVAGYFGGFPLIPDAEGSYTLRCPRWGGSGEVPFISISADYGDLVHGVFLDPETYGGRLVHGLSQSLPIGDMVAAFEKVTGKKSRFEPVDWESLETYGAKPLETVKNMFGFCNHSGGLYYGVPNDSETAAQLKAAASAAKGVAGDEAKLMTCEKFFEVHFGTK